LKKPGSEENDGDVADAGSAMEEEWFCKYMWRWYIALCLFWWFPFRIAHSSGVYRPTLTIDSSLHYFQLTPRSIVSIDPILAKAIAKAVEYRLLCQVELKNPSNVPHLLCNLCVILW
jgi:hypothetical protein